MIKNEVKPYFTIICPNYKTEPFLEQCLLSVKKQTFQDFECILVNDGSPGVEIFDKNKITNTSSDYWFRNDFENQFVPNEITTNSQWKYIFEQTVSQDSRFKYIDQTNTGQGIARNNALQIATGKRVVFLDCDDFLEPKYLENIYKTIENETENKIFYAEIQTYKAGEIGSFLDFQKYVPKNNNLATILTFPTWTLGPVNYFWEIEVLKKQKVNYPGGYGEDGKFFINSFLAYYSEYKSKVLTNFYPIENSGYNYRLFEHQNYRAKDFESKLFLEMTEFVKTKFPEFKKIGIKYYLLAFLYYHRFRNYRLKIINKDENRIKYYILNIFTKILTLLSINLSGFSKK